MFGKPIEEPKMSNKKYHVNGQLNEIPEIDDYGFVVTETKNLAEIIAQRLNAFYQGDETIGFDARLKRAKLAEKILDDKISDFTVDEIVTIKELTGKSSPNSILMQIDKILNATLDDKQ